MRGILPNAPCLSKRHQAIGVKSVGVLWAIAPVFQPLEAPKYVFTNVGNSASTSPRIPLQNLLGGPLPLALRALGLLVGGRWGRVCIFIQMMQMRALEPHMKGEVNTDFTFRV